MFASQRLVRSQAEDGCPAQDFLTLSLMHVASSHTLKDYPEPKQEDSVRQIHIRGLVLNNWPVPLELTVVSKMKLCENCFGFKERRLVNQL